MAVTRENGCYFSFCPISCASWLSKRMGNSFFLVLGAQSCAHFLQTHKGFRMFEDMRFACAVLEESDISSRIGSDSIKPLVAEIIQDENPDIIFLLGSCSVEILKMDLKRVAQDLTSEFRIPVVAVETNGIDSVWTQGEDMVLSSLVDLCPVKDREKGTRVVFLGSLPHDTAKEFLKEMERLKIPAGGFLPGWKFEDLPPINEDSLIAPLHPYLNRTLEKIQRIRGSKILRSLFPFGPDGSRAFFQDICAALGLSVADLDERERGTWAEMEEEINLLRGKKIFFIGDNLLEIPLARFLYHCGAKVVEVGTPYIHTKFYAKELIILKEAGVRIVEAPNNSRQLERIQKSKPDLVVAPLSLAYPLEKQGYKILWSIKFILPQIHGFSNCWRLVRLFSNSL